MTSAAASAPLVAAIESGDREAEAELVARYQRGVRVILRRTLNRRDVEDFAQEVFLLALEKIRRGEIREPEKLSGFICSLARNLAIGHLRKARSADAAALPGDPADPSENPLHAVLRRESEGAVRQTLQDLPSPRDRQLLGRFYLKEEPKEQLRSEFGLTPLHFNRVLHRARERFRQLYRLRENRPHAG